MKIKTIIYKLIVEEEEVADVDDVAFAAICDCLEGVPIISEIRFSSRNEKAQFFKSQREQEA